MNYDNSEDIIRNLINENGGLAGKGQLSDEEDIRRRLGTIDRKAAMNKLRQLGLGSVADKLKGISDEELIDMITQNPSLLKKINSFLK